ncbi:MAG TPA: UDP-N-acetylglucosamine 2-epimerase (non-hydrolyzing) [Syntrophobacteraceae bacterium]|nr:UDP-N-acetylglucosamine 2-epimerase (non-hydrolyzing) [Syntrophobacteraceae bacterium]HBZ55733.1 UDP-N-acetylglucosamine 2-epimerase (non-hydrolyzing) [Syntrophobacteraceae bacterium]
MKKHLFIFGTRPEAIKLAPLIRYCSARPEKYAFKVCVTAQHREMLDDVLDFFKIKTDFDLNLMKANQTLFDITIHGLSGLKDVLRSYQPDNIVVQGDTTTAFVGALAGFYVKSRISHIEAGLRSGDKYSPYPEEINRILVGHLADFHFAPTDLALQNLHREGIKENVWVVGNTVIDALVEGLQIIDMEHGDTFVEHFDYLDFGKRIVLITCHRRESFGKPIEDIFRAIRQLAGSYSDIEFVYPVHLNPNVQEPAIRILGQCGNVHLVRPLSYAQLIWIMNRSYFLLTDSGGIQEEAPSLGKPVLVMREVTERQEGITAGTARLVGTDRDVIVRESVRLIEDLDAYQQMAQAVNPYGDGKACERIAAVWRQRP